MGQKKRGRPPAKKPVEINEAREYSQPAAPVKSGGNGSLLYKCAGDLPKEYQAIKAEVLEMVRSGNMEQVAGVYPVQLTIELNRTMKNQTGSRQKMQLLLARQNTAILPIEYV